MWGKHCNFTHKTLWIAIVFRHTGFFPFFLLFFCYEFFQNYLCRFYFLNWAGWEFSFIIFFFFKTLKIATVFHHMVFFVFVFLWFFSKLSLSILFFNIKLLVTIIIFGESSVAFHTNYYRLLQWFHHMFFFFFLKLCLTIFFLILRLSRITITIKLNHVEKAL